MKQNLTELKGHQRSRPYLYICVLSLGELIGSVQIANMSEEDSGVYRCSVTNVLGTQNCYVNLSLYTREFQPWKLSVQSISG